MIILSKNEIDFGLVKEGTNVNESITLTNMFSNVINITGATASCGCTKPQVKIGTLDPGMNISVNIGLNTSGKKGLVKKTASINYTNKGIPERIVIPIKATVE